MGQLENVRDEKRGRKADVARDKAKADGWRGFVNVELTAAQKKDAAKLLTDVARLWDNLFALIEDGYKLTVSYDFDHEAYNVSLTCRADDDPNKGLTLTGRGGSVEAALVSFSYKHVTILEKVWGEAGTQGTHKFATDDFD